MTYPRVEIEFKDPRDTVAPPIDGELVADDRVLLYPTRYMTVTEAGLLRLIWELEDAHDTLDYPMGSDDNVLKLHIPLDNMAYWFASN